MRIEPEISGVTIVLVGPMTPQIFSPDWFVHRDLLGAKDVEGVKLTVVHPQLSRFQADWLALNVDETRFTVTTTDAPYIRLRDLVIRTFRECLPETPLSMVGINREVHYKVESMAARDRIGHALAPPEAWGEWAPKIKSGEGIKHGGLSTIAMVQRDLDDRPDGQIQALVQPSGRIENACGIYAQVNDHYQLVDPSTAKSADEMIGLLERDFETSIKRSEWIIDQVMAIKGQ